MLDQQFTKAMQAWLEESDTAPIEDGAMLLLRLNNNRAMYQSILMRRLRDKLIYELRKHLAIRLDGHSREDVKRIELETKAQVASTLVDTPRRGLRPDHEELPDAIKALPAKNAELFKKIKHYYNELLKLAKAEPCDRYEFCKALQSTDKKLHDNWYKYDSYQAPETPENPESPENSESPAQ